MFELLLFDFDGLRISDKQLILPGQKLYIATKS